MTGTVRGDDPAWSGTPGPLRDAHDVLLLDLDGVVYVGPDAVPGAAAALAAARTAGVRLAFVTNNANRTPDTVAAHLTELGVPATTDDVVTSAQAAATVLADQLPPGAKVLVIGGEGLRQAVRAVGLVPVAGAGDEPAAVVQGFSPDVGWTDLVEACVGVRTGVPYVATNPDLTIPTPRGIAPGNGALVAVVSRTTGVQPVVAGKPFDIAGAHATELPSLLVLTGVHAVSALLAAPPGQRPTYLAADLHGLAESQPGSSRDGDGWTCGPVRAGSVDGTVTVARTDGMQPAPSASEALCAVRAVCSVVWDGDAPPGRARDLEQAAEALRPPHGWDR